MTTEEFNICISEMQGRMLRFAQAILRNRADAEDVVSEVRERLWRERVVLYITGDFSIGDISQLSAIGSGLGKK